MKSIVDRRFELKVADRTNTDVRRTLLNTEQLARTVETYLLFVRESAVGPSVRRRRRSFNVPAAAAAGEGGRRPAGRPVDRYRSVGR